MTDGTGQIVNEYSYGPHGERLGIVEGTHNPFGYVGRRGVMEEGSGLKFMRGRYYDDGTGRFLNKDLIPGNIRKPQSLNRYAYVSNNPINLVDPRGLQEQEPEQEQEVYPGDPRPEDNWPYKSPLTNPNNRAPCASNPPAGTAMPEKWVPYCENACPPCDDESGCLYSPDSCTGPPDCQYHYIYNGTDYGP
ncbi:MAG: RHS repeat domain-containing protein [Syntrophobacteraceae bacterium]